MIKLIIFDWDDVFTLGSKEGYLKCYHEALVGVGVYLEPEEEEKRIFAKWGKHHKEELKELLKENPKLLDRACEIYESKLFGNTFVDNLSMIFGTKELVEKLSKKYILCVATGLNPEILKDKIIPKFNFPNVFKQIISSYDIDDIKKQKPDPYMVKQILKTQRIKPTEAVLVGDAKGDVTMARDAGLLPIVVLSGNLNKKEAEKLKVKYIIKDVTYLENVLTELNLLV
ncbi:MAG: HAD family hydrolase [Candidatus Pacebacteria bacterium]|nr:HAD family hydrolase [Candidatus Paceibacterota bacterium]